MDQQRIRLPIIENGLGLRTGHGLKLMTELISQGEQGL
ncbi:hypothetical protein X729_02155 [Mesorhizobium sp. L103C131B0]|nr:hypothetical protein X729_02155 [Mesorhizobium sp. L103C131B0]